MNRREFTILLGGTAAWPVTARAQQVDRVRRVAVLMGWSENDPEYRPRLAAFVGGLAQLGWTEGRNLRIDIRWTNGDVDRARALAKELVELQPDAILAGTTPVTAALQRETRTIPVVFAVVSDPVGAGFVASLPMPGGNITGFINIEAAMGGKWLELLKEVAPRLGRVAMMFNPDTAPGGGSYYLSSFDAAAHSLGVEPIAARVHSDAEIETAIASLGQEQGGLVAMTDSFISIHRRTIIAAAARLQVPAIFEGVVYSREGGLIGYGTNNVDLFRRAATYVDRILHGAKPGDLPVEIPTKFDLAINLKTAKALGLTVPLGLQAAADEVIE